MFMLQYYQVLCKYKKYKDFLSIFIMFVVIQFIGCQPYDGVLRTNTKRRQIYKYLFTGISYKFTYIIIIINIF